LAIGFYLLSQTGFFRRLDIKKLVDYPKGLSTIPLDNTSNSNAAIGFEPIPSSLAYKPTAKRKPIDRYPTKDSLTPSW